MSASDLLNEINSEVFKFSDEGYMCLIITPTPESVIEHLKNVKDVGAVTLDGIVKLKSGGKIIVRDKARITDYAGVELTTIIISNRFKDTGGHIIHYLRTRLRSRSKYSSRMVLC